jgi:hypothetical protein
VVPQPTPSTDSSAYIFSPRELQRLAAYRAAVVARFYNDDDGIETARFSAVKVAGSRRIGAR